MSSTIHAETDEDREERLAHMRYMRGVAPDHELDHLGRSKINVALAEAQELLDRAELTPKDVGQLVSVLYSALGHALTVNSVVLKRSLAIIDDEDWLR